MFRLGLGRQSWQQPFKSRSDQAQPRDCSSFSMPGLSHVDGTDRRGSNRGASLDGLVVKIFGDDMGVADLNQMFVSLQDRFP